MVLPKLGKMSKNWVGLGTLREQVDGVRAVVHGVLSTPSFEKFINLRHWLVSTFILVKTEILKISCLKPCKLG